MKERLKQLLELFNQANPATRMALVVSTLVIVALAAVSGWYANRPDLVQVWSNLNASDSASYKSALAEAGIPFRSSPPPDNGIWVDSAQIDEAYTAVALGGSRPQPRGISILDEGVTSPFLSADTRMQMRDKREWQECELMLETLDFVTSATVVGSGNEKSPFKRAEPQTISVTLDLRHGSTMTSSQARNVAALVKSRFDVPLENITIMDRRGDLLHDGATLADGGSGDDLFEQKRRFDELTERKINRHLDKTLGAGRALVTINSEWEFEELETIKHSVTPEGAVVVDQSTSETSSTMPGGPSSNITQDYGTGTSGVPGSSGGAGGESTTKEEEKRSVVGTETTHSRIRTPQIKRLSVSLTVDKSLEADLDSLGKTVKAQAGFDEKRGDGFESFATLLDTVARDDQGNPVKPEKPEPAAPPNEYMMLALEYGVEILAAIAFIFILLKSLRGPQPSKAEAAKQGAKGGITSAAAAAAKAAEESLETIDPNILARAQVEELVRSDPEKVSEILAQWAKEEPQRVGAA